MNGSSFYTLESFTVDSLRNGSRRRKICNYSLLYLGSINYCSELFHMFSDAYTQLFTISLHARIQKHIDTAAASGTPTTSAAVSFLCVYFVCVRRVCVGGGGGVTLMYVCITYVSVYVGE